MKFCSYCNGVGPLTKEHIWPRSLINKYNELKAYNPRTERFYIGEPVIKDVCSECNSNHLSKLDIYISNLYDNSFCHILSPGESVRMKYDYNLLLRSLLKISFNSCRAFGEDKILKVLSKYSRFIIGGEYFPKVVLKLQIVTSSRKINAITRSDEGWLIPSYLRCANIPYEGRLSNRFFVRMICINSYWFYIVMAFKPEPEHKWIEFLNGLDNWITPTGVVVSSVSRDIYIPKEKTTYMHPRLLGTLLTAKHD